MSWQPCRACGGRGLTEIDGETGHCQHCRGNGREPHADGVFDEDGIWTAYLNNRMVACGPDRVIIEAAFNWHANPDEFAQEF